MFKESKDRNSGKEILIVKKKNPTQTPKDLSSNVPERQVLLYQVGAVMFAGVSQLVGLHSAMQRKKELARSALQKSKQTTDHNSVMSHGLRNKRGELLTNSSDKSGLIHKIHYHIQRLFEKQ